MTPARHPVTIAALFLLAALSACERADPPAPAEPVAKGDAKSIFRPEYQVETAGEEPPPPALDARILFPEGRELTQSAQADLTTIINSAQVEAGGAIVLRGHSDAGGSDAANLKVSQARAEAVRDFLIANGITEDRIAIIAFGEQNPIAPNALPDGRPNEEGRARNRRVDVHVAGAAAPAAPDRPTLAETLSDEGGQDEGPSAQPPK